MRIPSDKGPPQSRFVTGRPEVDGPSSDPKPARAPDSPATGPAVFHDRWITGEPPDLDELLGLEAEPLPEAATDLDGLESLLGSMGQDLDRMVAIQENMRRSAAELLNLCGHFSDKVSEFTGQITETVAEAEQGTVSAHAAAGDATEQLMAATREMQEMQQSFNLQYLQLQNKISYENRQFSMVSNIMKNKHDTAKSSINNIR
ncbi:MAG: hypothetical protein JXQ27_02050 [Acidobacteria bacterium]|nr:hypothetical protein [Acidobacteriota bacterium]